MLREEINEILVLPLYNAVIGPFLPTFQPSLHLRQYLRRKCESLFITIGNGSLMHEDWGEYIWIYCCCWWTC